MLRETLKRYCHSSQSLVIAGVMELGTLNRSCRYEGKFTARTTAPKQEKSRTENPTFISLFTSNVLTVFAIYWTYLEISQKDSLIRHSIAVFFLGHKTKKGRQ